MSKANNVRPPITTTTTTEQPNQTGNATEGEQNGVGSSECLGTKQDVTEHNDRSIQVVTAKMRRHVRCAERRVVGQGR